MPSRAFLNMKVGALQKVVNIVPRGKLTGCKGDIPEPMRTGSSAVACSTCWVAGDAFIKNIDEEGRNLKLTN